MPSSAAMRSPCWGSGNRSIECLALLPMTIDNRYYDGLGDAWWDPEGPMGLLLRMNQFRYRYFRRVLDDPKGMKLVDIGCGGGFLAEAFAAVRGGCLRPGPVYQRGSNRPGPRHRTGPLVFALQAGVQSVSPSPRGRSTRSFSQTYSNTSRTFTQALAESSRVLKPGGLLLYETVNRTLLSRVGAIWFMERILKKIPVHSHDWKMFVRPAELLEALEACGLRNQELQGLGLKGGVSGFLLRAARGQDPWVFEIGSDTRVSYLGYAIKPA